MDSSEANITNNMFFLGLCHEPFWDVSKTWNTFDLRFGRCVERTVLVWAPCLMLWVCSLFYALALKRRPYDPIPWSVVTYTKVMVTMVLLVTAGVELVWAEVDSSGTVMIADFLAPALLLLTHTLYLGLVLLGRRRGERSSWLLWLYWLLVLVCGVPQLSTAIRKDRQQPAILMATFFAQYLCSLALFLASSVNDIPSRLDILRRTQKPSPELDASFLNRLFFAYSLPLIWRGWRRPLTTHDLYDAIPRNSAETLYSKWQQSANRGKNFTSQRDLKFEAFLGKGPSAACTPQVQQVALAKQIWRLSRFSIIAAIYTITTYEAIRCVNPFILGLLINFMTNPSQPTWHGLFYAVCLLVICEFVSLCKNKYLHRVLSLSVRIRTILMAAVYNKALHLSGSARRKFTIGQIVNLMAVDSEVIGQLFQDLCFLIATPILVLLAITLIWQELGPSALAGLGMLLLLIPVNIFVVSTCKRLQAQIMVVKDKRVKIVSEIIGGIKVLKLYAWEESFAEKVRVVREEEIQLQKKFAMLRAFNTFLYFTSPYMISLATFTCYLLSSEENQLDVQKVFVCLSLFNILRIPIMTTPDVISQCILSVVSYKRMESYLNADELDPYAVTSDPDECNGVAVRDGQFTWEGDEEQANWKLHDIELSISPGLLVALVGPVGSGKSSIMSALLGEMMKIEGKVIINGSVAYVSQHPWLQNATLRDNITWGQTYEPHRYSRVVQACALRDDFDMFPAGDLTEIGEKGINISGGQKQRIALARAVYSQANIFLLDDPLSAVDSHVGRHIFNQVIGPKGLLQGRTRILVTHAVTFLPQVDEVVMVQDGRLVERGSYYTLLASGGTFAQFVVQHIKDTDEEADEEVRTLCGQPEDVAGASHLPCQLSDTNHSRSSASTREQRTSGDYTTSKYDSTQGQRLNDNLPVLVTRDLGEKDNGSLQLQHQFSIANTTKTAESSLQNEINHSKTSTSFIDRSFEIERHELKDEREKLQKNTNPEGQKLVQEEISETGRVSRHVYKVYGQAMGLLLVIISIGSIMLGQASNVGSTVWLAQWSTSTESNNTSDWDRNTFLMGYAAFGLSQAFFLCLGILVQLMGSLKAANTLHYNLLDAVIRLPMNFFETNPSGRIINRFGKEIDVVDKTLPENIRGIITTIIQVMMTFVVILGATPMAAAVIIPILFVYLAIQQVFVTTSRQLKRLESVAKSPIFSHFSETIQGASVVRAFKKQGDFFSQNLKNIENSLKSIYINLAVNRWLGVHLETIGNLITFSTAVFGVMDRETTSPAAIGFSLTYALNVTVLLNWLVRIVSDFEASIVSVERIDEYIQVPQEAAWRVAGNVPSPTWPERGSITFKDYKTCYRPGLDLALKGITCTIKPAEKVGIVGRTGAGKTSLTMALFRIIEASSGSIDIDDVTVADVGLHDLRSRISIIPQDAVLFSGTVRMNLDPFGVHQDTELWHALELAHLSTYIQGQQKGLEHPVDEAGSNFSAGQRQLVCLARALLRKSRVLVLDEATAAVDLETDDLIQATIRSQFTECTIITIAHRLNTIMDSDRVVVLQEGKIAEFDSPTALLQQPNSLFYCLAKDAGLV